MVREVLDLLKKNSAEAINIQIIFELLQKSSCGDRVEQQTNGGRTKDSLPDNAENSSKIIATVTDEFAIHLSKLGAIESALSLLQHIKVMYILIDALVNPEKKLPGPNTKTAVILACAACIDCGNDGRLSSKLTTAAGPDSEVNISTGSATISVLTESAASIRELALNLNTLKDLLGSLAEESYGVLLKKPTEEVCRLMTLHPLLSLCGLRWAACYLTVAAEAPDSSNR